MSVVSVLSFMSGVLVWTFISAFLLKHFIKTFLWTLKMNISLTEGRKPVLFRSLFQTPVFMVVLPVMYGIWVASRFVSGR